MLRVVYDAGALIALQRRSPRMLLLHRRALAGGSAPIVPTIVLGQVWRGFPREVGMATALTACRPHVLDVITAKLGGQLCGIAGTTDLADAVVAVLAVRYRAAIVTSDPDELAVLTVAAGRRSEIFAV